jgi:hypothetical protein
VNATLASILIALAVAAGLPPAPTKVKYTVDKGDVTFDHAAHVGRRERCRTCHGEGIVQKVPLDKQSAHTLCIGCHLRLRTGPKACLECHVDD